jgi:hypothetical protein
MWLVRDLRQRCRPARGAELRPESAGRRLIDRPGCPVDRNPVRLAGKVLRDQLVTDVSEHSSRTAQTVVPYRGRVSGLLPARIGS